jgi:hypothetical protein
MTFLLCLDLGWSLGFCRRREGEWESRRGFGDADWRGCFPLKDDRNDARLLSLLMI